MEGAFDHQLVQEYNLGYKINGRDNVGGTRFNIFNNYPFLFTNGEIFVRY